MAPPCARGNLPKDPAGSPLGPGDLYKDCPRLERWRERDINYFMTARLTPQQLHYLVVDWGWAMGKCRDPRLERWFLTQLDVATERTQGLSHQADRLTSFWDGLPRGFAGARAEILLRQNPDALLRLAGALQAPGLPRLFSLSDYLEWAMQPRRELGVAASPVVERELAELFAWREFTADHEEFRGAPPHFWWDTLRSAPGPGGRGGAPSRWVG